MRLFLYGKFTSFCWRSAIANYAAMWATFEAFVVGLWQVRSWADFSEADRAFAKIGP